MSGVVIRFRHGVTVLDRRPRRNRRPPTCGRRHAPARSVDGGPNPCSHTGSAPRTRARACVPGAGSVCERGVAEAVDRHHGGMTDGVIDALRRALDAVPDDTALRLHLAETLLAAGRSDEAVAECATALQREPSSAEARALMARALAPVRAGRHGPARADRAGGLARRGARAAGAGASRCRRLRLARRRGPGRRRRGADVRRRERAGRARRRGVGRREGRHHAGRRRRAHRGQGPARGGLPGAAAQPRAAQAVREVVARRADALRTAGLRQDLRRARRRRRDGREVHLRGDVRRPGHVDRQQREERPRAVPAGPPQRAGRAVPRRDRRAWGRSGPRPARRRCGAR